jgi:hypothetical protein
VTTSHKTLLNVLKGAAVNWKDSVAPHMASGVPFLWVSDNIDFNLHVFFRLFFFFFSPFLLAN